MIPPARREIRNPKTEIQMIRWKNTAVPHLSLFQHSAISGISCLFRISNFGFRDLNRPHATRTTPYDPTRSPTSAPSQRCRRALQLSTHTPLNRRQPPHQKHRQNQPLAARNPRAAQPPLAKRGGSKTVSAIGRSASRPLSSPKIWLRTRQSSISYCPDGAQPGHPRYPPVWRARSPTASPSGLRSAMPPSPMPSPPWMTTRTPNCDACAIFAMIS